MSFRRLYQKINNIKLTKTGLFMLPTLGIPLEAYKIILINVFTTDNIEHPEMIIVFDNSLGDDFLPIFIKGLEKRLNHIETWMDDDNKEICVKMNIPEKFRGDYHKMMAGDYSKFSQDLKQILFSSGFYEKGIAKNKLDTFGLPVKSVFEVVYPTQNKIEELEENLGVKLVKPEILDKPNMDLEIYKPIKELIKNYEESNEVKK